MSGIPNFLLILLALSLFACQPSHSTDKQADTIKKAPKDQLYLYSYRNFQEDQTLFARFEELYNTRVNITQASNEELLAKLKAEKDAPKADLVLFEDLSYLKKAQEEGLLQPFSSQNIEQNLPVSFKDKNGYWAGTSKNFMGFIYRKDSVNVAELPMPTKSIKPICKGELILPADNVATQDFVARLLTQYPSSQVKRWLKNYADFAVGAAAQSDFEVIERIASGEARIGLISSASLVQYKMSGDPEKFKAGDKVGFAFMPFSDGKSYAHISGMGVSNGTPRWRDALLLITFLTDTNIQEPFNNTLRYYSVNSMALPSDFLIDLGGFQEGIVDYDLVWNQWMEAGSLLEQNSWK